MFPALVLDALYPSLVLAWACHSCLLYLGALMKFLLGGPFGGVVWPPHCRNPCLVGMGAPASGGFRERVMAQPPSRIQPAPFGFSGDPLAGNWEGGTSELPAAFNF